MEEKQTLRLGKRCAQRREDPEKDVDPAQV